MKLKIRRHRIQYWIALLYVLLVLYMPNAIRDISTVYSINATGYVAMDAWNRSNPWLAYSFSIIEIFSILVAILYIGRKKLIDIWPIVVLVFIKEIFRALFGATNMFQYGSIGDYSLILSLIVGYGCFLIITGPSVKLDIEDVLDLIIILNFVTQILFAITGRQMEYGGRYAALGSTSGVVGEMCFHYIIYYLFARNSTKRAMISVVACLLSLVLSGSRTNLGFTIIFIVLFAFKIRGGLELNNTKRKIFLIILLISIIAIPLMMSFSSLTVFGRVLDRMETFIASVFGQDRSSYLSSDGTFLARINSITTGLKILAQNPFGISSSTIDLQMETIANGYYTFPHSVVISYYLLWGVASLLVFGFIGKYIAKAIKLKSQVVVILSSIAISFLIYGSPIINAKSYFWFIAVFAYCKQELIKQEMGNTHIERVGLSNE